MAANFEYSVSDNQLEMEENMNNEQKNPLLMDVVFDKVSENLHIADLLICRVVCRKFRDNSKLKSLIKDKSVVSMRALYCTASLNGETISNYFQHNTHIYKRFHMEGIAYQNSIIKKVFEVLGPSMEVLKLHLSRKELNIGQFRELLYQKVVNLKELQIHNLSHEEIFKKPLFKGSLKDHRPTLVYLTRLELQEIRYPVVSFMTEFFSTLPNLREIVLKTDTCGDWPEQTGIWRLRSAIATSVIGGLKNSGVYKSLKEFRCGILRSDHFEDLIHMGKNGMQLEILELHMPTTGMETFCSSFLETQNSSLKELILFEQRSCSEATKPQLKLPESMTNLEILQLSKSHKSNVAPIFPVNYDIQCPKLKTIIFLGNDGYQCVMDKISKSSSVTSIVLHNRPWERGEQIGKLLGSSFTNLTKLSVRFPTKEFLSAMWNSCVKLKELSLVLMENFYIENRILGGSEFAIQRWLRWTRTHDQTDLFDMLPAPEMNHSIRNLKDLTKLRIIVEYDEKLEALVLTDATAFFGLRKMPQLRYLELYSSHWLLGLTECHYFSYECKELLRKDLELAIIHFTPAKRYDIYEEEIPDNDAFFDLR